MVRKTKTTKLMFLIKSHNAMPKRFIHRHHSLNRTNRTENAPCTRFSSPPFWVGYRFWKRFQKGILIKLCSLAKQKKKKPVVCLFTFLHTKFPYIMCAISVFIRHCSPNGPLAHRLAAGLPTWCKKKMEKMDSKPLTALQKRFPFVHGWTFSLSTISRFYK